MDSSCYKWTSLDPQKVYQQPTKKTHLLNWCRQWLKRKQKKHERRGEQERTQLKNHYVELKPKATRLTWIMISGKTKDPRSVGRKPVKGRREDKQKTLYTRGKFMMKLQTKRKGQMNRERTDAWTGVSGKPTGKLVEKLVAWNKHSGNRDVRGLVFFLGTGGIC